MKYYKNKNNEIYAYEDNEQPIQKGLTPIDEAELIDILHTKVDEQDKQLAQLEADIVECKDDIRHALIIGNASVLENLRNEYKSLLVEHEKLQEQDK